MGAAPDQEYCSFTKAIEYLGDRWSLLILAELVIGGGPQGFNALAAGLPGHISRAILTDRLRKLEQLGLIARTPTVTGRASRYCATAAGVQLRPTLLAFWDWAERWVPQDSAVAERDPDIVAWWLTQRVTADAGPPQPVVIDLSITGVRSNRCWLVVRRGAEPSMCLEDPLLDPSRYVYIQADSAELLPVARGTRSWTEAIADRSIHVYGEPEFVRALPGWFLDVHPAPRGAASTPAVA
jgi:DNA-binding HxlR family transcriptional regulator